MTNHLVDRLQPLWTSVSTLVPAGIQRRMFGNSMSDRLANLRRLGLSCRSIVDVGAYEGDWTLLALGTFPESTVLMVEAQESKRHVLDTVRSKHAGRVDFEIALVGKSPGSVIFYEMETGSSVYGELSDTPRSESLRNVQTLDHILGSKGFTDVDLLKLDVQGAELDVLQGAASTLTSNPVILLEVAINPYNRGAPLLADVIVAMGEIGYRMYDLFELKREWKTGFVSQIDAIFITEDTVFK